MAPTSVSGFRVGRCSAGCVGARGTVSNAPQGSKDSPERKGFFQRGDACGPLAGPCAGRGI